MELHHVAYLVKDIAASAREFSELFGYVIESEIIDDPIQTALVQFLRLPGATSWVELISPNHENSGKLWNALRKGGGMHHLCYEVQDVLSACSYFCERGLFQLGPISPARAFAQRKIAWFANAQGLLFELVQAGDSKSPLSLRSLTSYENK